MEFILNLFRRAQTVTRIPKQQPDGKVSRKKSEQRNDDDVYLNTLEDQILKSLNIKRENNDLNTFDSKIGFSQKTPIPRVSRKITDN